MTRAFTYQLTVATGFRNPPPRRCEPLHLIALHPTCPAYPWHMGGSRYFKLSRACGRLISSFQAWEEALNPRLNFIRH